MKSLFKGFLLLLPLSCFYTEPDLTQKAVIKVNSSQLLASDFAKQLAEELRPFDSIAISNREILKKIKNRVVENYIISVITKNWADTNNIFISNNELEMQIQTIRGHYPDDLSFRKALAEERLTIESWKKKVKDSLLQKKVQSKVSQLIPSPTEIELKSYYDNNKTQFHKRPQVKIQQIVVSTKDHAQQVLKTLKQKKEPETIAREFSITPEGKNGGYIGWIERNTSPVFDSAFDLKLKKWSPIVKGPFGYHVFRTLSKKNKRTLKFSEVRVEIQRILLEKKEQAHFAAWLEQQLRMTRVYKDKALIEGIVAKTRGKL